MNLGIKNAIRRGAIVDGQPTGAVWTIFFEGLTFPAWHSKHFPSCQPQCDGRLPHKGFAPKHFDYNVVEQRWCLRPDVTFLAS